MSSRQSLSRPGDLLDDDGSDASWDIPGTSYEHTTSQGSAVNCAVVVLHTSSDARGVETCLLDGFAHVTGLQVRCTEPSRDGFVAVCMVFAGKLLAVSQIWDVLTSPRQRVWCVCDIFPGGRRETVGEVASAFSRRWRSSRSKPSWSCGLACEHLGVLSPNNSFLDARCKRNREARKAREADLEARVAYLEELVRNNTSPLLSTARWGLGTNKTSVEFSDADSGFDASEGVFPWTGTAEDGFLWPGLNLSLSSLQPGSGPERDCYG